MAYLNHGFLGTANISCLSIAGFLYGFLFVGSKIVNSLSHLKPIFKALDGVSGRSTNRDGKNAEHLYVEVHCISTCNHMDRESPDALVVLPSIDGHDNYRTL